MIPYTTWRDIAFWFARAIGADASTRELTLSETVEDLERSGSPSVSPAA